MPIIFIDHQNRFCFLKSHFKVKEKVFFINKCFHKYEPFQQWGSCTSRMKMWTPKTGQTFWSLSQPHNSKTDTDHLLPSWHRSVAPYLKNKRNLLWQALDRLLSGVRQDWSHIEGQVIFYCPDKFDFLGKSVSTT